MFPSRVDDNKDERHQRGAKERKLSTLNVERVVDDKVSVPHHREVNGEVADVAALVVVLRGRKGETGSV